MYIFNYLLCASIPFTKKQKKTKIKQKRNEELEEEEDGRQTDKQTDRQTDRQADSNTLGDRVSVKKRKTQIWYTCNSYFCEKKYPKICNIVKLIWVKN